MNQWVAGSIFAAAAFAGTLLMIEIGRRIRRWRPVRDGDEGNAGPGTVESAIFALMSLLIAFTFSGAAVRLDARRQLIVEEANDIGTAYLRLDLLPPVPRAALQELFRQDLDARLAAYRAIDDPEQVVAGLARSQTLQGEIWTQAVAACQQTTSTQPGMLLLPAINAMFDIASTRAAAFKMHPPSAIFGLLGFVALTCALLAGFSMGAERSRSWFHVVGFAAIVALTIYVTMDLEYPRLGLIRVTDFDRLLLDVRATMR